MTVLAYELNEVPWRVLDDHVARRPDGALARPLAEGATSTTRTADEGHLSPWVTWPTLHRGVPNTRHGIAHLGQDPATFRFDPVWRVARRAGHSVGVFGALQGWPPGDPGPGGFHVPDTFAPDSACLPDRFEAFQRFNLQNARRSGRVVGSLDLRSLGLVPRLLALGVRPSSLALAARQLLAERRTPTLRHRRPAFQSVLGFDVFERAWRRGRPAYASFFTNHVAGFMHRFWRAAYPDDYAERVEGEEPYADAIAWGMDLADAHLERLLRMAPDATVVVASSMGQAAIRPSKDTRGARVADVDALVSAVGWSGEMERRPAMEPQTALHVPDDDARADLVSRLGALHGPDGGALFEVDEVGPTLSLTLRVGAALAEDPRVRTASGETLPAAALGLEHIEAETPGTAYHIPEGILLVRGPGVEPDAGRAPVSALDYAPTLLGRLGVPAPESMEGRDLLASAPAVVQPQNR